MKVNSTVTLYILQACLIRPNFIVENLPINIVKNLFCSQTDNSYILYEFLN
jgi:hypothetical protein